MNGKRLFWMGFIISIAAMTWRDIADCHALPWPPRYFAAIITFVGLDLFSIVSEELAGVMAIGITLAVLVNRGFKAECEHAKGTVLPASFQSPIPGGIFNPNPTSQNPNNTPPGITV